MYFLKTSIPFLIHRGTFKFESPALNHTLLIMGETLNRDKAIGMRLVRAFRYLFLTPNAADWSLYGGAESFEGRPRRTVRTDGQKASPPSHMAPKSPSDFLWTMNEEPHRSRRMALLKAHPEVRSLLFYLGAPGRTLALPYSTLRLQN